MKILICDDESLIAEDLRKMLTDRYTQDISVELCGSAEELKKKCAAEKFDIAFIDIVLDDGSGINAVSEICSEAPDMKYIFMTAHVREYAEDIFVGAKPYGYIGKPIIADKVYYYIDRLEKELRMASGVLRTGRGKQETELQFSNICRIESVKRKLYFTCVNGTVEVYDKMNTVEASLDERFIRCHQSYIVNADFIAEFGTDTLTMKDGTEISITRKYRRTARQRYFRYKGRNVL